ncbi:hypothetical protein BDD12DRAFT_862706 [Trichophaea hybrida]|nr:hypothetical protein BDD12DRAFT_862706 [Trichophaea hybrida]
MDVLKRPWILDTLTAAFQGRSGDEYTTTDGELIVIGNKKQFVQLTQIKSAEPVWVATLSDRMVLITAEFSKSCVSTFEMCGQPLTQFRGGVFQLKGYKFVFRDRNVAQGVTLKQPLENYNSGIPIPEKPLASTLTSGLKIIVDDMEFLGGAGTHVFDKPRAVGNFKELQQLLQQLRTKKSLLPGTRASSSSSRRHPVNMEHDGESSSQPFVTQAHAMTHSSDSEDSCGSVVSQQFDEDDSSLQFATHTHRQPRSKSHKSSLSRKWEQSEPATLGQNTGDIEDVTGSRKRTKAIRDYSDLEFPGATSCAPIRAAQNRDVGKGQFINAPPSSPPAQPQIHNECHCPKKEVLLESQIAKPLLSLHPGWGGMTEVTAQMAKIPLDQQKKLEKSGCTFSLNVCIQYYIFPTPKYRL